LATILAFPAKAIGDPADWQLGMIEELENYEDTMDWRVASNFDEAQAPVGDKVLAAA
jgi:hypothetical protein